ncbi:uncharacterized protein LOC124159343 [Ischnura elegans]|uniref:uncharacterized protein LOC124159343 n=1 Tax=Ischnura elegans TaxID=197161 RepID=UPI001ED8A872|nr:uncharacterized protein LOC124159343 [Ischnura elegans]
MAGPRGEEQEGEEGEDTAGPDEDASAAASAAAAAAASAVAGLPPHLQHSRLATAGSQVRAAHKRLHHQHHHHSGHGKTAADGTDDSWGGGRGDWPPRPLPPGGVWPPVVAGAPGADPWPPVGHPSAAAAEAAGADVASAASPPTAPSVPPTPPGFATSAPLVRAEEALIVLIVLLLWVGAIALFFNRWGKIRMLEPYQPKFQQSAQHRPSCPLAAEAPIAPPIVQFRSLSKFNLEFEGMPASLRPRQNSVFASAVFSPTVSTPRKAKSALDIQTLVMTDGQHLLQQLDSIDSADYPIRVTKV